MKVLSAERLTYYDGKLKTYISDGYVGKEAGKGLSSNDYTDDEKAKLASINEGTTVEEVTESEIDALFAGA